METIEQMYIKNLTYCFLMTWSILKLLKIDKRLHINIGIYNIGYITRKKNDDCKNINSVNPLYLIMGKLDGYIKKKKKKTEISVNFLLLHMVIKKY